MTYDPSMPMSRCQYCGSQGCSDDCHLGFECARCYEPISETRYGRTQDRFGEALCRDCEKAVAATCEECGEEGQFVVPVNGRRICTTCLTDMAVEMTAKVATTHSHDDLR